MRFAVDRIDEGLSLIGLQPRPEGPGEGRIDAKGHVRDLCNGGHGCFQHFGFVDPRNPNVDVEHMGAFLHLPDRLGLHQLKIALFQGLSQFFFRPVGLIRSPMMVKGCIGPDGDAPGGASDDGLLHGPACAETVNATALGRGPGFYGSSRTRPRSGGRFSRFRQGSRGSSPTVSMEKLSRGDPSPIACVPPLRPLRLSRFS